MTAFGRLLASLTASVVVGAAWLTVLPDLSEPLAAQVVGQAVHALAAKSDPAELPDAPSPAGVSDPKDDAFELAAEDLGWSLQTPQQQSTTTPSKPAEQAPQSSPPPEAGPSLSDLGLTTSQVKGSAQQQALLDRRTHMLKVHQRLGLLTMIPLAATLASGGGAKNHQKTSGSTTPQVSPGNTAGMDLHAAIGGVAVLMYGATAYYAVAAPRVPGTETKGGIRWHKALIWIHGPGMVLTPILGVIAFKQENSGEKVHGIAAAHGAVGYVTVGAYAASILTVSWPIKIKW